MDTTQLNSGLYHTGATELHDIFLAPLKAVIDAEMSLTRQIKSFIWKTGFTKEGNIKTVDFNYHLNGKKETLSVPVLSIVTLPLLGIKSADFDMHVKMLSVVEDHDHMVEMPSLLNQQEKKKTSKKKVGLKGYLTPHKGAVSENASMKTNMRVKLHMGESDMPGGITKILALLNNNLIEDKNHESIKK